MKKLMILLGLSIFLLTTEMSKAQVINCRAIGMSQLTGYGWGPWTNQNINIKLDVGNDIIKIYSNHYQEYEIVTNYGVSYANNSKITKWGCTNERGGVVIVKYIEFQYSPYENHIQIDFTDGSVVYNIVLI